MNPNSGPLSAAFNDGLELGISAPLCLADTAFAKQWGGRPRTAVVQIDSGALGIKIVIHSYVGNDYSAEFGEFTGESNAEQQAPGKLRGEERMVLVSVNGIDTKGKGYKDVLAMCEKRPCKMVFYDYMKLDKWEWEQACRNKLEQANSSNYVADKVGQAWQEYNAGVVKVGGVITGAVVGAPIVACGVLAGDSHGDDARTIVQVGSFFLGLPAAVVGAAAAAPVVATGLIAGGAVAAPVALAAEASKETSKTASIGACARGSNGNSGYQFGDVTRGVLAKGRMSRGETATGRYKFGDFARGIFQSAEGAGNAGN
jgi:hypothetical protein